MDTVSPYIILLMSTCLAIGAMVLITRRNVCKRERQQNQLSSLSLAVGSLITFGLALFSLKMLYRKSEVIRDGYIQI
jgi:threonine/homoserine/homoserine lactone efflux protein